MWLFTRYGFFSFSVAGHEQIAIRARVEEHLQQLMKRFNTQGTIKKLKKRDYAYRIVVPQATAAKWAEDLVKEMTWSNFKNEAHRYGEKNNLESRWDYNRALHNIWADTLVMQHAEHKRRGIEISASYVNYNVSLDDPNEDVDSEGNRI